jgi:hypothetical protein
MEESRSNKKSISFEISPKPRIVDKLLNFYIKNCTILDPENPVYSNRTIDKVATALEEIARKEYIVLKLKRGGTGINGVCSPSGFEKLFGAKVQYFEFQVKEKGKIFDVARYFELVQQPTRNHHDISYIELDIIYKMLKEDLERCRSSGLEIVQVSPRTSK